LAVIESSLNHAMQEVRAISCGLELPQLGDLTLAEIVARLSGRRTCAQCKAVYHLMSRPSKEADVCDTCRGPLMQREDDRPEAVRVRMEAYMTSTRPLVDYYARSRRLLAVAADSTPEAILERTLGALNARLNRRSVEESGTDKSPPGYS